MKKFSRIPRMECLLLLLALAFFSLMGSQFTSPARGQIRIPLPKPKQKQEQQQPTPTQSPVPGVKLAGIFAAATDVQIRVLNERGPQFATSFDTGSFTILAFIKGRWSLQMEYKLGENRFAVLSIASKTGHGFESFTHEIRGTGKRLLEKIQIPDRFGDKLVPGFITIESFASPTDKKKRVDFQLYGLGLGVEGRVLGFHRDGGLPFEALVGQLMPVSYSFGAPDIFSHWGLFQSDVIGGFTFNPGTIKPGQGDKVTYSFQPLDTFGKWAADFRSVSKETRPDDTRVRKTKWVRTDQFDEEIGPPNKVTGEWDGKDRTGKISRGAYRLTIRAWWSALGNGQAAIRLSDENIIVE